jgi:hypothetical protein
MKRDWRGGSDSGFELDIVHTISKFERRWELAYEYNRDSRFVGGYRG